MGVLFLLVVSVFFVVKIATEVKSYQTMGDDHQPSNVITVSGTGEVFAIPDTAKITFTVHSEGKNIMEAQKKSADILSNTMAILKTNGIDEKDIKTDGYNANPKYEWRTDKMSPCVSGYCPNGKNVIVGYSVDESISVKIKKVDTAGVIVDAIGKTGVSNISGPDFTVGDIDTKKAEARKLAIDNAKSKAQVLAHDLGVRLVRIVNFNENNTGGYPIPMMDTMVRSEAKASVSTMLPVGENKITSDVSITYEIR